MHKLSSMIHYFLSKYKIRKSKKVIEEALKTYPQGTVALAWTGGKDSTLILWMTRRVCAEKALPLPRVMFIDEGDVFDEIRRFTKRLIRDWKLTVDIVRNDDVLKQVKKLQDKVTVSKLNRRNKKELKILGFSSTSFPFEPESLVGNHLMKTVPMKEYLEKHNIKALITGIRRDEQEARRNEVYFSKRTNPTHVRVHPLLHFSERDVWHVTHTNKIPYVGLYKKGYRSLGARSSTVKPSTIPAWQQDLKHTTERVGRRQDKEKIMEKLRKLGYM